MRVGAFGAARIPTTSRSMIRCVAIAEASLDAAGRADCAAVDLPGVPAACRRVSGVDLALLVAGGSTREPAASCDGDFDIVFADSGAGTAADAFVVESVCGVVSTGGDAASFGAAGGAFASAAGSCCELDDEAAPASATLVPAVECSYT